MTKQRTLAITLVALIVGITGTLACARRAKAQSADLKQEGWRRLIGGAASASRDAHAALKAAATTPAFRIDPTNVLVTDADGSGTITPGDYIAVTGTISGSSGVVGDWQGAGIVVGDDTVATLQFRFAGSGTIVVSGGTAYSDGVRSGTHCRAIVGGTGRYAGATGNAGVASDGTDLFIGFGVR